MNRFFKASAAAGGLFLWTWGWWAPRPARGEVVDISAVVDATVIEFEGGEAVLVDRETLNVSAGQSGAASASIVDAGPLGQEVLAKAKSRMFFRDPFTPGPPGEFPGEFGGELLAVTVDAYLHQQVTGDVFESRSIRVTPEEAGLGAGSPVGVTGEMYLHGAALVFSDRADQNLDTLEVLVGFEIELQRQGRSPRFVLSGALEIRGAAGNTIAVTADGILQGSDAVVMDLSGDFPELGTAYLVMFPHLLVPYVYDVTVEETYDLTARLRLKGTTVPEYVGVAVRAGGPFEELGPVLDALYDSDVGTRLQARVAAELGSFPGPEVPTLDFEELAETCAPMGVEAAGLAGLLGWAAFTSGGRRRTRRRLTS